MKYLVEIDDETAKGAQLISFIEKRRAPKKAVVVRKERPIKDIEMGLPAAAHSTAQFEAWLEPKEDEEEMLLSSAIASIKKKLITKSKAKKLK